MNKKVLSAILFSALFAGTGTFTSCIDNDEPAGIEELRGAKAELLKAQAAMELADEAYRRAQVANQELMNEAQKITNQMSQIDLEMKELDLKIKEAKAEAEIQDYLHQKQQKENAIAVLAETFKKQMLDAQALTVKAQADLDKAIKEAEIAKLTLSTDGSALVEKALGVVRNKQKEVETAYDYLVQKQEALNTALKGDSKTMTSLSKLQNALLVAQNEMKVEELKVADAERMLELAKNFDTESWSIQLDTLRADSLEAAQNKAAAQVNLDALYAGAEYQAAEKAYKEAALKLGMEFTPSTWKAETGKTTKVYTPGEVDEDFEWQYEYGDSKDSTLYAKAKKAATDSLDAVNGSYKYDPKDDTKTTSFKLEAYESETVDEALQNFFNNASSPLNGLAGYNANKFAYDYSSTDYKEKVYREDSAEYKEAVAEGEEYKISDANSSAMKALLTVEGWVNALNAYKTDTNGIAWSQVGLDIARKDSADAQAAFDLAKAKWQVLVDAVNGKAAVAPTDSVTIENGSETEDFGFEEEVAKYNDLVDSLAVEVAYYNNTIDSIAKYENSIYDEAYNESKTTAQAAQYLIEYKNAQEELYPTVDLDEYDGETLASLQSCLTDNQKAMCKTAADLAIAEWLEDNEETLEENAENAGNLALATDEDDILSSWTTEYENAEDSVNNAVEEIEDAWDAIGEQYAMYINLLAADYGQVIAAKNLTKVAGETADSDSIAAGEAEYNFEGEIKWDLIAKDFGGIANIANMKNKANTADSTYISLVDEDDVYTKIKVVGSDISDAEKANLSVTEIDKELAITNLVTKSNNAFGNDFNWTTDESRLVEVTKEMIKAEAKKDKFDFLNITVTPAEIAAADNSEKKAKAAKAYESYGALGELMFYEAQLELVLAYKDADKLVEPLLETLTAQFDALKAEIAANSAIVAAVEKIAADAWTAFEVGEAMVDKAKDDRDALSAEAEAEVKLYAAIITEKAQVIESAEQQLEGLLNVNVTGSLTPEKLILEWETRVANAQGQVEAKKLEVIQAEKAIELYEAGEYTQAYDVAKAQLALEGAQANYDAAVKLYEIAVAEFNAILEALAK